MTSAVETRLLVQEGLSIGLASNVIQSQFAVLVDSLYGTKTCRPLTGGTGSSELLGQTNIAGGTTDHVDVYYAQGCAHPYVEAVATLASAQDTTTISETDTYLSPAGALLGVLRLRETANLGGSQLTVHGLGTFTPHDGAPAVSLGLACGLPSGSALPPPFVCRGAVAQSFPGLGLSLASVTPLTLTLHTAGANGYTVAFVGAGASLETGAVGALSIVAPTATTFAIGAGRVVGSATASGHAGSFALFPPTPTGWEVTDAADKATFSLRVLSNAERALTGTVTDVAGKSLAQVALDQSGTGKVTYEGGTTAAITSWTLGG
jgi:hypothetical protein